MLVAGRHGNQQHKQNTTRRHRVMMMSRRHVTSRMRIEHVVVVVIHEDGDWLAHDQRQPDDHVPVLASGDPLISQHHQRNLSSSSQPLSISSQP